MRVEEKRHHVPEKHALLALEVTHRTQAGVVRPEQYPVNAWRHLAAWALEHLKPGNRVLVLGYLTQNLCDQHMQTEVTASRILPLQARPAAEPTGHSGADGIEEIRNRMDALPPVSAKSA